MSRYDAIGLFWQDMPSSRKRGEAAARPMPPIPETGWRPPSEFPNLSAAKALSFDTETFDPELEDYGPGWGRGKGHIVGLSIAVPNGPAWYFPIRHEVEPEYNMDPRNVLGWFGDQLRDTRPKIGANLLYDLGWLKQEGIEVGGPCYDIQFAEALLNSEAPDVSLDALATKYLGMHKETSLLYKWCADFYGGNPTDRQRKNMYRTPPRLAGPYGEADAKLPMLIMDQQWPAMALRDVHRVFDLESRLIPLLLAMRWQGVPVDVPFAEKFHKQLGEDAEGIAGQLKEMAGRTINPYSGDDLAQAFRAQGLTYSTTATGKPSFTAPFLERHEHPFPKLVTEYRKKMKLRSVFIESYILNSNVNGRVYCQFHPLRGDENGARSGRFSSSTPNLQNIPVRTKEGKLIRACFTATLGGRWRKFDYSQIEYRLLAHHAVGPGADEMRQRFINDPSTDYHEATIELVHQMTGILLDRKPAKNINFGLVYGMSRKGLIGYLGLGDKEGQRLYETYHKAAPFVKATIEATELEVNRFGTVSTLLGRKSDFNQWTSADWNDDNEILPFDEAVQRYARVKRAFTHKALNRKLQGGAADVMKKAMVDCWEGGVFAETGIPLLTVHDELDFDDVGAIDAPCWTELKRVMETCIPEISIPIRVDGDIGTNWGNCE